jgi:hypothetical protein
MVQFSHFSVKEFLTAHRLAEPMRDVSRYHIRLEAAHTILAQACLGVLLRLDDRVDRDSIKSFPLARYAAQYWPTHGRVENVSSHIKDGMERLFDADKPHFATWLWIYDEWKRSMSTMRPEVPGAVPLYHAARLGFRDLVERLIVEHPEHLNARGGTLGTPMHAAVLGEHVNILSSLIEHGADMECQAGWITGGTPLQDAAYEGRLEVGQCLLERGAVIDAQNKNGETALHYAAKGGYTQAVQLLLEHGADVNLRDKWGHTPSNLASSGGFQEIVELLSAQGAVSVKK